MRYAGAALLAALAALAALAGQADAADPQKVLRDARQPRALDIDLARLPAR